MNAEVRSDLKLYKLTSLVDVWRVTDVYVFFSNWTPQIIGLSPTSRNAGCVVFC